MTSRPLPEPAPSHAGRVHSQGTDEPIGRNGFDHATQRDGWNGARPAGPANDASKGASRPNSRGMVDDLADLVHDLRNLAALQVEEARLLLRFKARRLFVLCVAAMVGLAAMLLALAACVRGLAGGFAAATGVPWMGDALAGVTTLVVLLLVVHLRGRHLEARALRRLERRFGCEDGADLEGDVEPEAAS